jgi:copper homeostasis protein
MLEICTFSLEDAFTAVEAGAERLEVCRDYRVGGLTPPPEWIFALKHSVNIPLVAMVRPRAGNFTYSSDEWAQMQTSGLALRKAGAHALVFGGITAKGRLDIQRCKQFIQAVGLPCVLHRAFDELSDPNQGLEDAVSAGFSRILTGYGSLDLRVLHELKKQAGQRIEILPGGGIRSSNAATYTELGFRQLHSSAILDRERLELEPDEVRALLGVLQRT